MKQILDFFELFDIIVSQREEAVSNCNHLIPLYIVVTPIK